MEKTKAYKTLLRLGIVVCLGATCLLLLMMYSNNFWPLCIAFGVLGLSVLPFLPIMMENCSECTYPVAEEVSVGILWAGCNVLGLGFIFAMQYLIEVPRFSPPPFLPVNFFMLGVLLIAGVLLLFYDGEYKRMKHEKMEHLDEESNNGYHPPLISSSSTGLESQAMEDSSLVRITDSADNSLQHETSLAKASTSMNFWVSVFTVSF